MGHQHDYILGIIENEFYQCGYNLSAFIQDDFVVIYHNSSIEIDGIFKIDPSKVTGFDHLTDLIIEAEQTLSGQKESLEDRLFEQAADNKTEEYLIAVFELS